MTHDYARRGRPPGRGALESMCLYTVSVRGMSAQTDPPEVTTVLAVMSGPSKLHRCRGMTWDLTRILLLRFAALWLGLRVLASLASLMVGVSLAPSASVSLRFALLVALVAYIDLRRRGDRILLADLAVGTRSTVTGAFCVGLFAEGMLGFAFAAFSHAFVK